ncbi:MAG: hypothetical protein KJ072_09420 [Verrucomicrobia bacterium]|nr:hypothetical protein [Verrucomicrobiota bacterium]
MAEIIAAIHFELSVGAVIELDAWRARQGHDRGETANVLITVPWQPEN